MQLEKFYPSIKSLINLDKFPEELSFLKSKLETSLQDILYDDLVIEKSPSGDTTFYKLVLLTNSLDFDIFDTDFKIVINPSTSDFSEIPISYRYSWPILKFLKDFDTESFEYNTENIFNLLLTLTSISEYELINLVLNDIIDDEIPQNIFIDDINSFFCLTEELSYSDEPSIDDAIYDPQLVRACSSYLYHLVVCIRTITDMNS